MKKNQVILLGLCGTLMISSCTTSSAGAGAMNGAMLGGWFGSAIGGIVGGPYGHEVKGGSHLRRGNGLRSGWRQVFGRSCDFD